MPVTTRGQHEAAKKMAAQRNNPEETGAEPQLPLYLPPKVREDFSKWWRAGVFSDYETHINNGGDVVHLIIKTMNEMGMKQFLSG